MSINTHSDATIMTVLGWKPAKGINQAITLPDRWDGPIIVEFRRRGQYTRVEIEAGATEANAKAKLVEAQRRLTAARAQPLGDPPWRNR